MVVLFGGWASALHAQTVVPGFPAASAADQVPVGYSGPGDVAPSAPSGPAAPGRTGGTSSANSTPAGVAPKDPGAGSAPASPTRPLIANAAVVLEPTWDQWWELHRDEFLDLRERTRQRQLLSDHEQLNGVQRAWSAEDLRALRQALVQQLQERNDPVQSVATIYGVARLGEAPLDQAPLRFTPHLIAYLEHPNPLIASDAALALGVLADPVGIATLQRTMAEPKTRQRVRGFAAYGLGLSAIRASDGYWRERSVHALLELATSDLELVCTRIQALGLAGSHAAMPLRRLVSEKLAAEQIPPSARPHLWAALGQIAGTSALRGPLIERACLALANQDTSAREREGALLALGAMGSCGSSPEDARCLATVLLSTQARDVGELSFAWMALAELGARDGEGEIPAALRAQIVSRMVAALEGAPTRAAAWISLSMGVLQARLLRAGRSAQEPLQKALRERFQRAKQLEERSALAIAMGLTQDRSAAVLLEQALREESYSKLRAYLALGLGLAQHQAARDSLQALAARDRSSVFLIEHSALALALLGDREHVLALASQWAATRNQEQLTWLTQAVGLTAHEGCAPLLYRALCDQKLSPYQRGQAAQAIGQALDRDRFDWTAAYESTLHYRASSTWMLAGDGSGLIERQ